MSLPKFLRYFFSWGFVALLLSGIVYAWTSGFRLISLGGMDFASFFSSGATMGVEADSFHDKTNDTWLAHPLDGNNYLWGDTYFGMAGSSTGVITTNGDIGIGTSFPATKLDIYDNTAIPMFRIGTADHALYAGAGTGTAIPWIGSSTDSDLAIVTNSTTRMFVWSGGNVGIGTITPVSQFQVYGSWEVLAFGNGTKTYPSTPAVGQGNIIGKSSTADYRIALQDGAGRVNHYWNAYYDTTAATHKYQVSSEAASRFAMSAGLFGLYVAPSGTAWSGITWTTAVYINNSWSVGIGTAAPTEALTVSWNVSAADPISSTHLTTKAYVDAQVVAAWGGYKVYKADGVTVVGNFLGINPNVAYNCGAIYYSSTAWALTSVPDYECQTARDLYFSSANCLNISAYTYWQQTGYTSPIQAMKYNSGWVTYRYSGWNYACNATAQSRRRASDGVCENGSFAISTGGCNSGWQQASGLSLTVSLCGNWPCLVK